MMETSRLIFFYGYFGIMTVGYCALIGMALANFRRLRKSEREEAERLAKTRNPEMKINS